MHTKSVEPPSEREKTHTNRTQADSKDLEKTPNINIEEAKISGLSARKLGERLGLSHVTLGRKVKKGADIFAAWSKELDPDGLVWELRGDKYHPLQD